MRTKKKRGHAVLMLWQIETIRARYLEGESQQSIAESMGISVGTVHRHLESAGLTKKYGAYCANPNGSIKVTFNMDADVADIIKYTDGTKSTIINQILREYLIKMGRRPKMEVPEE